MSEEKKEELTTPPQSLAYYEKNNLTGLKSYTIPKAKPATETVGTGRNNGGATDMYNLPPASRRPTIDDLIEHKKMPFWRGNCFKALYALDERASRASDGTSSELRELYKILYYTKRRISQLTNPN